MGVKFSPIGNDVMFFSTDGIIADGGQLFFYAANTSTKQNTYTTSAGSVANTNPIVLDAYGKSTNQIWLTEGQSYKVVLAPAADTDPPASGVVLGDYITGINDASADSTLDQWESSGFTPTYISGTSFSVTGDQTSILHIGRRLLTFNTGGSVYSTITNSVYGSVTTVTIVNDSSNLDAGLSAVSYGILSSVNPSIPKFVIVDGSTVTTQSAGNNTTLPASTAFVTSAVATAVLPLNAPGVNNFRLTLASGDPVNATGTSGASTVYLSPYHGNRIAIYNGSTWDVLTSSEVSIALGTLTNDLPYDVFAYNNAGTVTLELLAWTNTTTRATGITLQDGTYCKSGQLTRRYLGSFLTTSTTTTEDTTSNRFLFNYDNLVQKGMLVLGASTWNYTTATWRQANADTANQLNFFIGVVERPITAVLTAHASNTNSGTQVASALGLNQSSSVAFAITSQQTTAASNDNVCMTVSSGTYPTLGKNFVAWMEHSQANGTTTWKGSSGQAQSGVTGLLFC